MIRKTGSGSRETIGQHATLEIAGIDTPAAKFLENSNCLPQMLPFQIKICGITEPQHAIDAMEAGADAIGLNFFQKSKRSVDAQSGASIVNELRSFAANKQNCPPKTVGVFVNHNIHEIVSLASHLKLDGIQLHGDETVDFLGELTRAMEIAFKTTNHRPFYIRAVRTQPTADKNNPADRGEEVRRVKHEIADWVRAGVELILLDAASAKEFGGTGKTIDWTLVPNFQAEIGQPIVLAGGLTPANVKEAIQISGVKIVDTASGVESAPGLKLKQSVVDFVTQANSAFSG